MKYWRGIILGIMVCIVLAVYFPHPEWKFHTNWAIHALTVLIVEGFEVMVVSASNQKTTKKEDDTKC